MNILPSSSVSPGRTVFSGGTPCQDPANIAPTRLSASIDPRTCPRPRSASVAATTGGAPARGAVTAPTAIGSAAPPPPPALGSSLPRPAARPRPPLLPALLPPLPHVLQR